MSLLHLPRPDGETIAYKRVAGSGPAVVWIGGFRSDMEGTKALALDAAARERGWSFVRYDHFAHGASSGDWRQATIGRWAEDAAAMVDHIGGPVIPVGSSMGGWVALLLALARPEAIRGVVLINPAPDFTERLMWPGLSERQRQAILRDGEVEIEEPGLGAYPLTRRLFEDAREHLLLDRSLPITATIHILQGRADDVVPWDHQFRLIERLEGGDVRLDLVDGGDHRLSSPADLDRLIDAVEAMRNS